MPGYILTIDLGTSSTKTTLWQADGKAVADASRAYPLARPQPAWAEIDPALWWSAVCQTIQEVISMAGIHPGDILGLGVDGLGWTLIPVDASGNALFPALIWLDRRAEDEAGQLREMAEADAVVTLSANPLDAAYITPKMIWFRDHHPALYDLTACFLNATGYIVHQLTGEQTCDFTQAYGYHFYDIRNRRWDSRVANLMGLSLEKMPALHPPEAIVGVLTDSAAEAVGLQSGIPVIAGGLDASIGALGAGALAPGQTVDQGGQAGGMLMAVEDVIVEPRLIFGDHAIPGLYLLQSGTVGGGSLDWFWRITKGEDRPVDYTRINDLAGKSPVGSQGLIFLPYMAGERTPLWNSKARGVFFGASYNTTEGDFYRAMMEGCAYSVHHNLILARDHGVDVDVWLGNGGGANSDLWCQIKADVSGRPFLVKTLADGRQGGHTLGLFALIAKAVGLGDTIPGVIHRMLVRERRYEPNPLRHADYQKNFTLYLSLVESLLPEFDRLAEIQADGKGSGGR